MSGSAFRLFVSVPVACFRVAYAREYWETYHCPPPSTVYGMLLSLVGETDRLKHKGAELALAMLSHPLRSTVLRTLWRMKDKKSGLGLGANKRPDLQELLTDIRLSVWVRKGKEENGAASFSLVERVKAALDDPAGVSRFGALSLGESTHLVDEIRLWRGEDPNRGHLLVKAETGPLTLPVWPDHVGAKGTRWGQFDLEPQSGLSEEPRDAAWVLITPP